MRIAMPLVAGVFDSGVSVLLDLFATAHALSDGAHRFEVVRLGLGDEVVTGQGARHSTQPWKKARARFDRVVVPGFCAGTSADVVKRMQTAELGSLVEWVAAAHRQKARIDAACSGTWVLGSAGLLDGREATTSWWFAEAFAAAYPKVRLDAKKTVVHSGTLTTAGAAFAHIDLGLSILRSVSPALAMKVANHLVTESRPSQAVYSAEHHVPVDDAVVRKFEKLVTASLAQPFSLEKTARQLGTSPRTLQRKVTEAAGQSPMQFVQALRLRRALGLLRQDDDGVDAIAAKVGYQNGHTLRQLIRRELGAGVRELRARG